MPRKTLHFKWNSQFNLEKIKFLNTVFYLNSNNQTDVNLLALGAINQLKKPTFDELELFQKQNNDWLFGYFGYDAKNQLLNLESNNKASHNIKDIDFVVPEIVLEWVGVLGRVHFYPKITSEDKIERILKSICEPNEKSKYSTKINFKPRVSKEEYLKKVNDLKGEIQYGNIYEINYCQEFFAQQEINPYSIYQKLNTISPTPYSCFVKRNNFYVMCASPEQYLQKTGNKIVTKPIKGTIKRSSDETIDENLKKQLYQSEKDRAENVMIVDLVRNDLSKCAEKGSVKVEELFGVYSFAQVHQMISTISATLKKDMSGVEAIQNTFPMGSMTGAPKIKAMQLIEKEEAFKRNLYSGSVGYFTPIGDFNFNVIIRSLFYSSDMPLLTFAVGGAITDGSDALDEYDESMLKAKAIFDCFGE